MEKSKTKEDASPLSTSTESETFDTWTLITDKAKDLASEEAAFTPLTPEKSDDDDGDNADDTVHVEPVKDPELLHERYNDMDDLSDGISIISECESAGRLSPHPELRKRLSDLNMLFINVPETARPAATTEVSSQTQNYDACSERSSDTLHRVEPLVECSRMPRKSSSHQVTESTGGCPAIHGGVRGLFYVGALLAIIAFIGKVKYDAWESVLGTKTAQLTQKITELELNNNLMRAEIDILSKQVKHLTILSENQKPTPTSSKPKNSQPRDNAFKAWPGNGNKIEEVLITPEQLKEPFECDNDMCIDWNEGVTVEISEGTDFVVNNDKPVESLPNQAENSFVKPTANPPAPAKVSPAEPQQPKPDFTPHEHKAADQYEGKKQEKREKKHSKNHSGENKENDRPRRNRSSEERDNSAERYKRSKDYKKSEKQRSSAEYEKAKREADGYWHEKMMQHRENSRKNNEKYRQDKNWYIERGDSREQARYDHDHKYREKGQR